MSIEEMKKNTDGVIESLEAVAHNDLDDVSGGTAEGCVGPHYRDDAESCKGPHLRDEAGACKGPHLRDDMGMCPGPHLREEEEAENVICPETRLI
ncbi:MAG: hypothetical protein IKD66_05685 [Solobacterium sp.]|nr:hypothetical protein [Solobacterium sp.]